MANPVYHVTFTKDVADIQKRGLDPLSQSLWEKAETGERYQQDPSVYGFSDPKEALNWATKMAWEFEASPSDISILTLEGGDHWQKDPSGDLNLGQSAQQSLRLVEPSEVLDVFSLPEPVGTNAEFQEAVPGGDFEDWKDFYSKRLGPRPPDQSNLPAAIGAAAEASRLALPPDDKPGPKGKAFGSGIGSLMFRRMFPLIQAVQQGYEHLLTEDQKREMREFLAQPTHEFFGFEKSGLESLKEKLGISDDDIPGLGHNQGSPLVEEDPPFTVHKGGKRATKPLLDFKDDVAVSQSTIKRRLRSAKDELSDIIGMPLKRISTVASWSRVEERVQRRMDKLGKNDPLLAKRMDGLWAEIMELKPLVDPDTRFGPSWRTHPEQGPPPGEWETRWKDTVGTMDDFIRMIEGEPTKKQEGTLYEALNSLPGHIRGYTGEVLPDEYSIAKALSRLSPDAIRAADRFLKQRDGKGLLDHTFPQTRTDTIIKVDPDLPRTDPETVQNRIRNILDPGAQSYIQLVDEEPPDTTMAYGGFVVKPLYDP